MRIKESQEFNGLTESVELERVNLNNKCAELVALLQSHFSFPVEAHNVVVAVQALLEKVNTNQANFGHVNSKEPRRPRYRLNDDVAIWREDCGNWFLGHISWITRTNCINFTYRIVSADGAEIDVSEDIFQSVDASVARLPIGERAVDEHNAAPDMTDNAAPTPTNAGSTDTPLCRPGDNRNNSSEYLHIPDGQYEVSRNNAGDYILRPVVPASINSSAGVGTVESVGTIPPVTTGLSTTADAVPKGKLGVRQADCLGTSGDNSTTVEHTGSADTASAATVSSSSPTTAAIAASVDTETTHSDATAVAATTPAGAGAIPPTTTAAPASAPAPKEKNDEFIMGVLVIIIIFLLVRISE